VEDVCLKRVQIGEQCEDSAQCQGGSSCNDKTGKCEANNNGNFFFLIALFSVFQCPDGYEGIDGICVKKGQKPKYSKLTYTC
jgi:hypothetical protein